MIGFITISIYVIITAVTYPTIPNALGPAFFPILCASMLGGLSIAELCLDFLGKASGSEEAAKAQNLSRILTVLAMLLAVTLFMEFVNPWIGVLMFLYFYIRFIAKESWKRSATIAAAGTAVVYFMVQLLQIRL